MTPKANGEAAVGGTDLSGFPAFRPTDPTNPHHKPGKEPKIWTPPRNIVIARDVFGLTAGEKDILAGLEEKERIVRARIRTIALPGYNGVRGFFFFGPPGHGKSLLLRTELDAVRGGRDKWVLYNSDMSPPALVAEMEAHCKMPLVLEDCEQLLANPKNRGILRSAMAPPYKVNPKNMQVSYDFVFRAPIYIVSNLPLNEKHGVLAAIASRTGPIWWQLTRPELAVRMKAIALSRGNGKLTVAERWEVAEYCIDQMNSGGRVDLRTLCDVGLPVRLLYKNGELKVDWRDYIDSHVRGTVEIRPERRNERIDREQHIACEIYLAGKDTDDRHRLWEEKTGLKKTAFRDRLREARANGLFEQYRRKGGKSEITERGSPSITEQDAWKSSARADDPLPIEEEPQPDGGQQTEGREDKNGDVAGGVHDSAGSVVWEEV
ncbi:MAG: hypothetical protein ABSB15_29375 [Bryobacteraceae bacterium]